MSLDKIFRTQKKLQKSLGNNKILWHQGYINMNVLALQVELGEAIQETCWKNWKKNQVLNKDKFKEELVDCLHFYINLCLAAGFNAKSLEKAYFSKNKINFKRKKDGY